MSNKTKLKNKKDMLAFRAGCIHIIDGLIRICDNLQKEAITIKVEDLEELRAKYE